MAGSCITMISIQVKQLTKRFGGVVALDRLDLTIKPGELFFLLGPSGCGKTTLLRSLAGFCAPDQGQIFFGEDDVTQLAPHKRNTGMMFQGYALWPHLTVAENVAFGLEERHLPASEIKSRVAAALAAVHLDAQATRKPNELSGGQQQRVALARALVIRPRCLLLDEPLSNLDAKLRLEMRQEIRRVCQEYQLTTVYVTHDQKEALSIADRLAILEHGRILQMGTPREVYRQPISRTVAHFIGETNFIPAQVLAIDGRRLSLATAVGNFEGSLGDPTKVPVVGSGVTLSIRPECWELRSQVSLPNCIAGRIGSTVYLGEIAQHEFIAEGGLTLKISERNPRFIDSAQRPKLYATVDPDDVVVLVD